MKCGSIVNHRKLLRLEYVGISAARYRRRFIRFEGAKDAKNAAGGYFSKLLGHTGNAFDFDVRLGDRVFAEKSPVNL